MVDANQLTGDNWQLAVVRGERLEGLLAMGYWLLDIGDIIQQHLRSHNATSAEKRGQLTVDNYQLTVNSWQLTVDGENRRKDDFLRFFVV